ncbi:RHS repeat-associated core domain-containing protein, partial [Arthrospira platensis SPKY1]|nr:RHS repeat-associated core domain-containing protein [Arthrospira platensis SPKY1]
MQPIDQADPVQAYRYNGKELTLMGGLYDYGFRYYDPMIGRFIGVDPIAEKFPHVNVYNYAENEPIANIDLWGLQAVRAENYVTSWTANKMAANNGKSYAQNFQDLIQNESGGDGAMQFLQGVREGFNNTGRWIEGQMPAEGTPDPSAYEDENYTHQGAGIEMVTGLKLNANGVLALPSAENGAFTIVDDMEVGAFTLAGAGGAYTDAADASTTISKTLNSFGLA